VRGHVELLEEVHRRHVPRRGEPGDPPGPGVRVDGRVRLGVELHPVPVVDVPHPAPRRVPLDVPLVARCTDLRGALLELDRVAACVRGLVDQSQRVGQLAVVVDADLPRDVDRVPAAHDTVAERSPGDLEEPEPRLHDHQGKQPRWPGSPRRLNAGQTLRQEVDNSSCFGCTKRARRPTVR
jgi:hypothetical protein